MKLAELRLEMDDASSKHQRGGRLEKWKKLTADAALKNHAKIPFPDTLESPVGRAGNFRLFLDVSGYSYFCLRLYFSRLVFFPPLEVCVFLDS